MKLTRQQAREAVEKVMARKREVRASYSHQISNGSDIPDFSKFGEYFYHANTELFNGCGCKKDAIPLLNRATSQLFRDDTKEKIVKFMTKKNPKFTLDQMRQRIDNAYASWISSGQAT